RRRDSEVALARKPRQQYAHATEQQAVQAHSTSKRVAAQRGDQRGSKLVPHGGGRVIGLPRCWPVAGQAQSRRWGSVDLPPVIEARSQALRAMCLRGNQISEERRRRGETRLVAGDKRVVARAQLADEYRQRPA